MIRKTNYPGIKGIACGVNFFVFPLLCFYLTVSHIYSIYCLKGHLMRITLHTFPTDRNAFGKNTEKNNIHIVFKRNSYLQL